MDNIFIKASRYSRLFWNEWNHDKDDISYNIGLTYDITGNLNRNKLIDALKSVIERNIVFRSYFEENKKGKLFQYFLSSLDNCIHFKDLSKTKNSEASLKKIFNEACNYKFDLSKPPLIRFFLVRLSDVHHVLILRFHHIIIDGTGGVILPLQIEEFYNSDEPLKVEDNSKMYFDYLRHEDEMAEKYDFKKACSYWNELLGDNPLSLNLTNKKVAKKILSSDSISLYYFEADSDMTGKIEKYCRKYYLSPSHFFMAVWSILLSRYTGENSIPLSFPINMRPKKYKSLIACLVNMLPLIVTVEENELFLNLAKDISKQVRTSFRYKDISFSEMITEYYKSTKNSIDTNMFNIGINGTDSRTVPLKLKNLPDAPLIQSQTLADYDINLEYQMLKETVKFQFNYCTELFNESYITDLSRHFSHLLNDILEFPDKKISDFQMLGNKEYNGIVNGFNNTYAEYPSEKTIQQVFEEQAERTPNSLAIVFDNKYLTYRALNEKANQLAHTIREDYFNLVGEEVKNDTLIGVYIDRGINMIIAILAILKSGAAYVPFDLHDPEERLKFKINDCGAKLVLTALDNVYDLVFLMREDAFTMSIDTYWPKIEEAPVTNPDIINKPLDLAYVIYTSGSTGTPKGVMQTHRTVTNLISYQKNCSDIDFESNILQFTSITFDVSVQEFFSALFLEELYIWLQKKYEKIYCL